jgi:hypothetical protein
VRPEAWVKQKTGISRGRIMNAKVIQGSFLGGQPKLAASVQAKMIPPPIQAKTAPDAAQPSAAVRISPPIRAGRKRYRLTAGAGGRQSAPIG